MNGWFGNSYNFHIGSLVFYVFLQINLQKHKWCYSIRPSTRKWVNYLSALFMYVTSKQKDTASYNI